MSTRRSLLVHVPIDHHDATQNDHDLRSGAAMFFASAVRNEQRSESPEDAAVWTAVDASTYEVVLASFDELLGEAKEAVVGVALLRGALRSDASATAELDRIERHLTAIITTLGEP